MEINRLTRDIKKYLETLREEDYYKEMQEYYNNNLSKYYFPNHLTAFYPRFLECKTSKDIVCNFSEVIIPKGEIYINYRPLIECLDTKHVFVLKRSIKCAPYYYDALPTNIRELEDLNTRILCTNIEDDEINLESLRYYGELKLLKPNKTKKRLKK